MYLNKLESESESHMTFSNKIQAKTFSWPDMSFYALGYTDVSNKGIEQACSWATCDIHISPFSIYLHFRL